MLVPTKMSFELWFKAHCEKTMHNDDSIAEV